VGRVASGTDANTDGDADPAVCAPAVVVPLAAGAINGSPPLDDDAVHYLWEATLGRLYDDTGARDVAAYRGDDPLWSVTLPDGLMWSSVMTVTAEHIIGTATAATASDQTLLGFAFPASTRNELLLLDRDTGAIVFRAPTTDDATSTVTVGPDGSLYVTMLGLLSAFCVEQQPTVGLLRFAPAAGE